MSKSKVLRNAIRLSRVSSEWFTMSQSEEAKEAQLSRALRLDPTERIQWLEQNKQFMTEVRSSESNDKITKE